MKSYSKKVITVVSCFMLLLTGITPLVSNGWVLPGTTLGVIAAAAVSSLPVSPAMYNPYAPVNVMFDGWGGRWFLQPLAYVNLWNGSIFPDLVDSYSMYTNNLTLLLHVRENLTWFNGEYTIPLTARDVWADLLIKNYVFDYWIPYISKILLLTNNWIMIVYKKPWPTGVYQILSTTSPYLPYFMVSNYTTLINQTLWKYG
jgi:hypothetical protein